MIRVGIIGCGTIAGINGIKNQESHAYAIKKLKRLKLVSCYDIDIKKRMSFSKYYKCLSHDSIINLLNDKLDIISICTPDSTHFEIAKKLIENLNCPKIIFIEKPVCENEIQYKNLKRLIYNKNINIIVNHSRRFNRDFIKLRMLIKNNFFGKFISGNSIYYKGWRHNGVHIIDTLIFLLQKKIKIKNIINVKNSNIYCDPTFDLSISVGSIRKSNFMIKSFDDNLYQVFDIDLFFDNGRVVIRNFGNEISIYKKYIDKLKRNKIRKVNLKFNEDKEIALKNAYSLIQKYLLRNNNNIIKDVNLSASLETMKIIWNGTKAYEKQYVKD